MGAGEHCKNLPFLAQVICTLHCKFCGKIAILICILHSFCTQKLSKLSANQVQIECKFLTFLAILICTQAKNFECKLSANRVQIECKFLAKSPFLICTLHSICAQFAVQKSTEIGDSTLPCTQFAVLPP